MASTHTITTHEGTTTLTVDGVPNFDAMSRSDLWAFWKLCGMSSGIRWTIARAIFPDRPKNYVRVASHLKNYACNKAVAMKCRIDGDINAALVYEGICDRIYNDLPTWAKW